MVGTPGVGARHDHLIDYRSDVEGLRAVAVLSVVAYHLDGGWLPGGFVGVDIFFVISGYLITALLLRRISMQRYSIANFYAARVRRIFPALFVVLAASTGACYLALPPQDALEFGRTLRSTALFYSNIEFSRQTGYFDGAAELKPLLHTWSLAVEEQFYLLFPPLLAVAATRLRPMLQAVLVGCAVLSLALSVHWAAKYPTLGFYSSFSRAHELLIGAWIAAASPHIARPALCHGLSLVGVALLAGPLLLYSSQIPFPGAYALLPCLGAALLIVTGSGHRTLAARALSLPPMRFVGAISYSLYLWHWPVIVFSRHALQREPALVEKGLLFALMIALAALSWRFVERPARSTRLPVRSILALGGAAMLVTVAVSASVEVSRGFDHRFDQRSKDYFAAARDFNPRRSECHASDATPLEYAASCVFGAEGQAARPVIAVWADSHGAELAPALGAALTLDHMPVAEITYSSCPPTIGFAPPKIAGCVKHNNRTLQAIASDSGIHAVVLVAHYGFYATHDAAGLLSGLENSIRSLRVAGKQVVVVAPVPTYDYPVPQALGMRALWKPGEEQHGKLRSQHEHKYALVLNGLRAMQSRIDFTIYDPADFLCATGTCMTTISGQSLYFDSHHLSMTGAAYLSREMAPLLKSALH